jgi:ABC-type uncharacterized transport system permease subunit
VAAAVQSLRTEMDGAPALISVESKDLISQRLQTSAGVGSRSAGVHLADAFVVIVAYKLSLI